MSVLLKKPIFDGISNQELVEQLEARKKSEKKLPTWFEASKIYYPNKLNIEQTSSEITARYKAEIVSGKTLLDVTGGLGVDSYFFSKKIEQVFHCEIDKNLSDIAAHNFKILGAKTIHTKAMDGLKFLKDSKNSFDWIYLDPSRRKDSSEKVFVLSDCTPNVVTHLDLFFSKSDYVLIKTSPLLDVSRGIGELMYVKAVCIIAVANEVKEALWVLKKKFEGEIEMKSINFTKGKRQTFNFSLNEEKEAVSTYSGPFGYLYEPNAAILKAGAFKVIGNRFKITKLHRHTHLYTSDEIIDFPGKVFKIEKVVPYTKKNVKQLGLKTANVKTRNFPEKVVEIRKKFGLKDGGHNYLFFVTDHADKKIVLHCSKT